MSSPIVQTFAALTAVGATGFQAIGSQDNILIAATVASIGTNVVIALQGSVDAVNWFNLNSSGNITLTANGTYGYSIVQVPVPYVRGNLISISGGSPSVIFSIALSTAIG